MIIMKAHNVVKRHVNVTNMKVSSAKGRQTDGIIQFGS